MGKDEKNCVNKEKMNGIKYDTTMNEFKWIKILVTKPNDNVFFIHVLELTKV